MDRSALADGPRSDAWEKQDVERGRADIAMA
jgi:hypothetical protein